PLGLTAHDHNTPVKWDSTPHPVITGIDGDRRRRISDFYVASRTARPCDTVRCKSSVTRMAGRGGRVRQWHSLSRFHMAIIKTWSLPYRKKLLILVSDF